MQTTSGAQPPNSAASTRNACNACYACNARSGMTSPG